MSNDDNILRDWMFRVTVLLNPVAAAAGDRDRELALIAQTGWRVDRVTGYDLLALDAVFGQVRSAFDLALLAFADPSPVALVGANIASFVGAFEALHGLDALAPPGGPSGLSALTDDLLKILVDSWLDYHPAVAGTLWAVGLYTPGYAASATLPVMQGTTVVRDPWQPPVLRIGAIGDLLGDPAQFLADEYALVGRPPEQTADAVFPRVARLLSTTGTRAFYNAAAHRLQVGIPGIGGGVDAQIGLELSQDASSNLVVTVNPSGSIDLEVGFDVLQATLQLSADASFSFSSAGLTSGGTTVTGLARLAVRDEDGVPAIVLGSVDGTHLSVKKITVEAGTTLSASQAEHSLKLGLDTLQIVVDLRDFGDGFLDSTGDASIDFTTSFAVAWSTSGGLRFEGSAGLEIVLGERLELGPLTLQDLRLAIRAMTAGLDVAASLGIAIQLGPVRASVAGLGVRATLTDGRGSLGFSNAVIGLRPPSGIGLAIDAGPVSGGGLLSFDAAAKRYTGVAQLDVYGVAVRAVGIVDTVLPDGTDGYSFLLLITTEFTPIQLGFGFTLKGVGGLVGIQRTLDTDALRAGVRDGSIDHILFPADPVRDAASLIPDLQRVFPLAVDQYVFGPMFKIGYGTPTLVEAELGVILKVPDPVLVVVGTVSATFPTKEAAVVVLNLDVLGVLDFGQKLLSIDASLRDSRVAAFAVSGDMAMRLSWGDDPSFALSIGGLNPHFQPPPNFPTLRRVSISAGSGDNPRLSFEAYLALTSNSLQFGARVSLHAAVVGISVDGYLGFDALVIFSPFSFRFDFAAGLALKAFGLTLAGVTVEGTLEGPTPWHVRGHASISVLFFDVSVNFDARFGDGTQSTIPTFTTGDVVAQVVNALSAAQGWAAALPEGLPALVSFGASATAPDTVRLDPLGTLTVRQKVAPLNRAITKLGGSPLAPSPLTLALESVQFGDGMLESPTVVTDHFAPGQFEDLSDSDQLSRPSFELMDAGVTFGVDAATTGATQTATLEYETIRADLPTSQTKTFYRPPPAVSIAQTKRGPVATSSATRGGTSRFAPPPKSPPLASSLGDGTYVVATSDTLALRADITSATAYGGAASRLAAYLVSHPAERGQLQVVPNYEAV